MYKILFLLALMTGLISCSRKHTPEKSGEYGVITSTEARPDSVPKKKTVRKISQKQITPDVITVNDRAARKSIDGRLYYDLLGHRYWKNYRDGKYYLFNQKMYDNPAFKPPK